LAAGDLDGQLADRTRCPEDKNRFTSSETCCFDQRHVGSDARIANRGSSYRVQSFGHRDCLVVLHHEVGG
jgi:hypothetical protein